MNMVILRGHLGDDPELKQTPRGISVCKFSLATNENYKTADGNRQTLTEWHRIVVWRKQAEIVAQYLRKGSEILIRGRLRTRSWEEAGVKRYITEVVADDFEFCGGRNQREGGGHGRGSGDAGEPDIPF